MSPVPTTAAFYRHHLLEDIVPFWFRHAVDEQSGGLFTCLADDGTRLSDDKYLWSQGRAIWTFAALYNHVEASPAFLELAENIAAFVLNHGRDANGCYLYKVSATGTPLEGPVSIYADFFAAYGLAELHRATGKPAYRDEALRALRQAAARLAEPGFDCFAPYARPEGVEYIHGASMILLETTQEVARSAQEDPQLPQWCADAARTIMERHVQNDKEVLLEHLDPNGHPIPSPMGRAVNPGHAIESMWFVIHHALRHEDQVMARKACEVIRWHLERGWDPEFGGLFLAIDAAGGKPWWPHADTKIWWPHTETIYALHLAKSVTGESWCSEWLDRISEYTFSHFPDTRHGEWCQRLSREGSPITKTIALPVKDPFHLPRALIRTIQLLETSGERGEGWQGLSEWANRTAAVGGR